MNQDRTARTVVPGWGCQHRTARTRQLGQNRKEKTARKGKACKAARTGQLERDSQNGKGRTRLQGQN